MYILTHKFGDSGTYYVRINDNGSWDELESPVQATLFPTAREAVEWSKENTTFGEYASGLNFDAALKRYQKYVDGGMVRRSFKPLNTKLSRKYNNESPKEILKWWIDLQQLGEDEIKYEDYKTWPKLYERFKHLFDTQSYHSKDYKTRYHTFQMRVGLDSKLSEFKKELALVIDHITHLDERGNKVISIFDYTLSEDGGRDFIIRKDGTYAIAGRWGDDVSGTLEEVFDYWKTYRYYD